MWLCSKQSSFFSFNALPSGGKSKDAVVRQTLLLSHRLKTNIIFFCSVYKFDFWLNIILGGYILVTDVNKLDLQNKMYFFG